MPRVHRCRANGCHNMVEWPAHYCTQHKSLEAAADENKRNYWKYNHIIRNRSASKREQYKFYKTPQWKHLRQLVLDRDYGLCQYCKANGKITPANTVDHVVPIEIDQGLATIAGNLATICTDCHRQKTAWEQSYYGTGQTNSRTGLPEIRDVKRVAKLIQQSKTAQRRG
ncbi:HNH endonuclease [Schleiferilactobacillus harbinensis]|uniref:Putative HNH nuclease YajD n=2 Tax=Schleiferilactobacillus harbinensis TaxID=304207 RepID=A0A5P8MAC6_9LACO|nr:HNH endonuclease [Schleiferilactobacillus harbinensis]